MPRPPFILYPFSLILSLLTLSAAAAPVEVPRADAPQPPTPNMGVNLEQVVDYARSHTFVDCIKAARKFGSPQAPWDEKAPLDPDGWPTADAGTVVFAETPIPPGDYLFSCEGYCQLAMSGANGSIKSQAYNRTTNTTSASLQILEGSTSLYLSFTNTRNNNKPGLRNIRLLRPGYKLTTDQTFSKEFLAALAPFSCLRTMDFTRTNDTDVKEWADRPKPTDARQSTSKGVAWEYAIALANQSKKDLWINIPDQASDDYVRNLAKLFKEGLAPDRALYLEYSNEVWNGLFKSHGRNLEAAKAEVAAGDKSLSLDGADANQYYWGYRRVPKRLLQVAAIFRETFGNDAFPARIRPVLASQSANVYMARLQLEYVEKYLGPPSTLLYGLAGAPYIDPGETLTKKPNASIDDLVQGMLDNPNVPTWSRQYLTLARYYRLHHTCYEGGVALEAEQNIALKAAANKDPRIAKVVKYYFNLWYAQGGELFMYYNLASPYGKYGCWGLTDDIRSPTAKFSAVKELLKAPSPPLSDGTPLPATLDATQHQQHDGGGIEKSADGNSHHLAFLRPGHFFDYLLRVPDDRAGNYAISLLAAGSGEVELLLSSTPIGSIAINTNDPQSFALSRPLHVTLQPGQLVLRLRVKKEGLNIRSIALQPEPR